MVNKIIYQVYNKLISKKYGFNLIKSETLNSSFKTSLINYSDFIQTKGSSEIIVSRDGKKIGSFKIRPILNGGNEFNTTVYHCLENKTMVLDEIKIENLDSQSMNQCFNLILMYILIEMHKQKKNRIIVSGSEYCLRKIQKLGISSKLIYSKSNFTKIAFGDRVFSPETINTHVLKIKSKRIFKIIWKLIIKEFKVNSRINFNRPKNLIGLNH